MKFLLSLLFLASLATASFAQSAAPSPSPAASPAASPAKHHRQKKTEAAAAVASPTPMASPAAATVASPAPATPKKVPAAFVPSATAAPGGGNGQVWVNTSSKTYHKEGSKWYGKTKHGKYMSEQDAIKEGDHAAKH
jgi:hypothetical protein